MRQGRSRSQKAVYKEVEQAMQQFSKEERECLSFVEFVSMICEGEVLIGFGSRVGSGFVNRFTTHTFLTQNLAGFSTADATRPKRGSGATRSRSTSAAQ